MAQDAMAGIDSHVPTAKDALKVLMDDVDYTEDVLLERGIL